MVSDMYGPKTHNTFCLISLAALPIITFYLTCLKNLELEEKLEELKKRRVERMIEMNKSTGSLKQSQAAAAAAAAAKSSEPKEAELTEEEKAKQRSKPISSTAVPGTPWCVVWTRDKRVFFYNPSEKQSLWERPHILQGRLDVDKLVKEPPAGADLASSAASESTTNSTNTNSSPNTNSNVNNSNTNNNLAKKKSFSADNNNTEPPLKKNK